MYKLLIFDKDNTLVRSKHNLFPSYKNQEVIPEMKQAIFSYLEGQEGIELMIATNQGGVAYPLANESHPKYKDLGGLVDELLECSLLYGGIFTTMFAAIGYPKLNNNWLLELNNVEGSTYISLSNFGDYHANFRKPSTGMIQRAIIHFYSKRPNKANILFIGDSEEDRLCAEKMDIDYKTPQEFIQWVDLFWGENFSSQDTVNGVWSN